jgi:hypothetical protein
MRRELESRGLLQRGIDWNGNEYRQNYSRMVPHCSFAVVEFRHFLFFVDVIAVSSFPSQVRLNERIPPNQLQLLLQNLLQSRMTSNPLLRGSCVVVVVVVVFFAFVSQPNVTHATVDVKTARR